MKILKLSELVGQKIVDLRFHYVYENEYGLQEFESFIKLENDSIITIPIYDNEDFIVLSEDNQNYLKEKFNTAQKISNELASKIINQKIVDLYFCYFENEITHDLSAFLKLDNGFYLSEYRSGPSGITNVDIELLNEQEFEENFDDPEIEIRSYLQSKT